MRYKLKKCIEFKHVHRDKYANIKIEIFKYIITDGKRSSDATYCRAYLTRTKKIKNNINKLFHRMGPNLQNLQIPMNIFIK